MAFVTPSLRTYSINWYNIHDKLVKQVVYDPSLLFKVCNENEYERKKELINGFVYEAKQENNEITYNIIACVLKY